MRGQGRLIISYVINTRELRSLFPQITECMRGVGKFNISYRINMLGLRSLSIYQVTIQILKYSRLFNIFGVKVSS